MSRSSTDREQGKTSQYPDVAVGPYIFREEMAGRSPRSQKKLYTEEQLPTLVVEVTSDSTRTNDLYSKWAEYVRCGIEEYMMIDRSK